VPTSRLEAFSDGVFAIAATLLILNVSVAGGPLGPRLIEIWPSYVAYAVSRRCHRRRVRQSIRKRDALRGHRGFLRRRKLDLRGPHLR